MRAQCVLRLAPYVSCDTPTYSGVVALSSVTLAAMGAAFPAAVTWALWHGERGPAAAAALAPAMAFLERPVRATWWRPLWVGPARFAKKLVFAALVGASDFAPRSSALPMSVFVALLVLLLLQVRARGVSAVPPAAAHVRTDLPRRWRCGPMLRR
jgi:hypothetical protein